MKRLVFLLCLFITAPALSFASEEEANRAYGQNDYQTAFELYLKAAQEGSRFAQYRLGKMYNDAQGVEKNPIIARDWLSKAAAQDYALAYHDLGVMHLHGDGGKVDYEKAIELFDKAHHLDWPPSSLALAQLFLTNEYAIPRDVERAKPYLMHAVEEGMPKGIYLLAWMHLKGLGYEQNELEGLLLLIQASNLELVMAQNDISRFERKTGQSLRAYLKDTYDQEVPEFTWQNQN